MLGNDLNAVLVLHQNSSNLISNMAEVISCPDLTKRCSFSFKYLKVLRKRNCRSQGQKRKYDHSISCLLTALIYFASWVPYSVVCFISYMNKDVPVAVEYVSIYMSKSATISSPIVFCLVERKFRRFLRRHLCNRSKNRVAPAQSCSGMHNIGA